MTPIHCATNDADFLAAVNHLDLNLQITNQPANSPDLNVNDLGFFISLQKMQLKTPSTMQLKTLSTMSIQLKDAVEKAYHNYPSTSQSDVFLTLQAVMNCILEVEGGNNYELPHLGRRAFECQGILPTTLLAPPSAFKFMNHTEEVNKMKERKRK